MNVSSFYQRLLQLPSPWCVAGVEVPEAGGRVDIWLEHEKGAGFGCPVCGRPAPVYDHTPERRWRHLNTCEYETWLHARLPRVCCAEHGTLQVSGVWAEPQVRLTKKMDAHCISMLEECSRKGASKLAGLSWDEVDAVMERAVERGMARRDTALPEALGIDEKSVFARHQYFTIITDIENGQVQDVIDGRKITVVEPWFAQREKELAAVKTVAMDMSAGYANVVSRLAPHADICFDHFHVTM
jgi:transposase